MEIFSYFCGRRGCIAPLFVNLLDSFRIMMKKLWMLPVLLLAAVACSDDNGGDDVPPPLC